MQIQPITNQPKFNGKLVIDKSVQSSVNKIFKAQTIVPKFKQIASIVQNKPYDVYIYANNDNPKFFCVAANKTEKLAKSIKEYTVKIQPEIMAASIVDAAHDAIEMYEKYISKSIKG